LLNGLTVGLLAVGFVLVYKSNRFLNLAHAQLGTLSALLLMKWVLDWGWSWWAAFVVALVVGVVVGLLVDRLFVRPLRRRGGSPVRLMLLSLAVSQVLLGLTFVPALAPNPSKSQLYPEPFASHLRVGGVVLNGMSVLTAVVVPIVVVALALFMRYSTLGRQIRAAANNPEAARLCGISVDRVSAITWGMAGGLAALTAVLQAPNQPTFNIAGLGPYLLMLTLGAAAAGAFVSLPAALGGGVLLGVVSQVATAQAKNASAGEVAVFVTILLVVFIRGRAISRVFSVGGRVVEALPAVRVPANLRNSKLVRYQRLWLGISGVVVALIAPRLPYFNSEGHRFLLVLILLYALLAVALTMLVGWGGQVSLGHFAVVGLGAYMAARLAGDGWSLLAIMAVAGLLGAVVMVLVGLPALRVGGLTLAVTTMGFAVIAADWLFHQSWPGSSQPFVAVPAIPLGPDLGTPRSELAVYQVALVVLVLGVAAAGYVRRLGPGRLVIAVRDNERAASSFGLVPASIKLSILGLSGLFAGVAGVLWAAAWHSASPDQFGAVFSIALVALPVIGGLGSIGGGVAAAVLLYAASFFIGPSVSGLFGNFGRNLGFQLFVAGIGQVTVLLAYPNGIAGVMQSRWQAFLDRRSARVAETEVTAELELTELAAEVPVDAPVHQNGKRSVELADVIVPAVDEEGAPTDATTDTWLTRRAGWRPEPDQPPLVTEGVRVHFGGVVALDGAEIQVDEGQIVGLIGPNGAGKTTLMNVISGVQRADRGSVRIFGSEIADLGADFRATLGVARSFQDATLFPGLTVTETIQVALARRNKVGVVGAMVNAPWVRAAEWCSRSEAEQIVARFGLTPWANALTQELSTGTRRICDLAAQVAARPRLLLLDEPTAGVAQREAEAFLPLLRRIRDELGCSVLIVEHDMPLLMGLCDRVYAMEAGRVIAEGTPQEVRHNPDVVASYLGSKEAAISRSDGSTAPRGRASARR
jgi:ABC-type branched-subunit amino acid transport system ATPase component/branched-subunit amino acid ABC-type transport system permease component